MYKEIQVLRDPWKSQQWEKAGGFMLLPKLHFRLSSGLPALLESPGHTSLYARSPLSRLTPGGHRRSTNNVHEQPGRSSR